MSDGISVPGYNDKSIDTIDRIMKPKREQLGKIEKQKESLKDTKAVWLELKNKTTDLQNKSKKLFNYDSPFDEKISESSNEHVVRATVLRGAAVGEYKIEVKERALSHRIASDPISRKEIIPKGDYSFKVGKESVNFSFSGETLQSFVDEVKRASKDNLKASITNDSSTTSILVLESGKSGEENRISFNNESTEAFLKKYGFIVNGERFEQKIPINKDNTTSIKNDFQGSKYPNTPEIANDKLNINSYETFKIGTKTIAYRDGLTLEIGFQEILKEPEVNNPQNDLSDDTTALKDTSSDVVAIGLDSNAKVSFKTSGDILIDGIFLKGESPLLDIPDKMTKTDNNLKSNYYIEDLTDDILIPKDVIKKDLVTLKIVTDKRTIELPELDISQNEKVLKFDIADLINKNERITGLIFQNPKEDIKLTVGNILFYDKSNPDGIQYKNQLSAPKDALIFVDGIEIKKPSNIIDDVIKGVTLNILGVSDKEESIKIDINYEKIVATIMDFLENYNSLMEMINKNTKLSTDEPTSSKEFQKPPLFGDQSLLQLASKLRVIIMNRYSTSYGTEVSMLSNIGISTNANSSLGGINASKILNGGLLEVNESLFIDMMEKYPLGIKELFGSDTNGDMIVDSGVGFEIDNFLKQYLVRSTGIFDSKQRMVDEQMKAKDKEIANYKTKMENEEKKLKEQFYKMERAANELKENSQRLDNFNKQN